MKMHKTILTLLAVMLAVIGTTGTVVHAEGPETPPKTVKTTPVVDQIINTYLDDATCSGNESHVPSLRR